MKLKDVKRGETFEHCGMKWIALEHDSTGHTLALAEDIISKMPFDEDNCNDWGKSSIRKYLNGDFFKELCGDKEYDELGFYHYRLDLTADDGLKDYGITTDFIFLLTDELYRKNRDVIKPIGSWWWTATPLSPCASYSFNSRYVSSDGTLGHYNACRGGGGARPACYLKSDILLSDPEEQTIEAEISKKILELDEILKLDDKTRKTVLNYVKYLLNEKGIK